MSFAIKIGIGIAYFKFALSLLLYTMTDNYNLKYYLNNLSSA